MKILWVKADFLHPTTKGGQIRTLEMLRRLHREHEVHYIGLADPADTEGPARANEYSARSYAVPFRAAPRPSGRFAVELTVGIVSPLPISIRRYRSAAMRHQVAALLEEECYDALVCDFLTPAVNVPCLEKFVLFQHNVETAIWLRHAEQARDPARQLFFRMQARRMLRFERRVARACRSVIAVSAADRDWMRRQFGLSAVHSIPTGVDLDYFQPPATPVAPCTDLVFVGSMDWMPNSHGMQLFLNDILPIIRRHKPDCSVAIIGRRPPELFHRWAANDPQIRVSGTVPDVRPYLWGSAVSIVPLYIGGGTRLKIYESMAAGIPVVSTTIGAEGLDLPPGGIHIADDPETFARRCLELLASTAERRAMSASARAFVAEHYSWDVVARQFAELLQPVVSGQKA